MDSWKEQIDFMMDLLVSAQAERKDRSNIDESGHPQWEAFERQVMFEAVNERRKEHKLESVGIDQIEKAERLASGHFDYSRKFAINCAKLGVGAPI